VHALLVGCLDVYVIGRFTYLREMHKSRGLFKAYRDGRNPEGDVVVKRTRESEVEGAESH
jgi:hypothetical protein